MRARSRWMMNPPHSTVTSGPVSGMKPVSQLGRHLAGLTTLCLTSLLLIGCQTSQQGGVGPEIPKAFAWWPPFPDEPRVQFVASYEHSEDILRQEESALDRALFGREVRNVVAVKKPYGVEMWNGSIYVCDIRGQQVVVFDLVNKQVRVMGTTGLQTLSQASDIAIAPDGMKYVSDGIRGVVFVFDRNDRYITMFGHDEFKPTGVAVYGDRLYTCDFASQSIVIMDRRTGEVLGSIGERGPDDGQFVRPLGIDTDTDGNIYVTDVIKCRVQKFSPEGELLDAFGSLSDNFGSFYRPKHVAVGSDGTIYIVDSSFQNVQIFDQEGQILTFFGSAGPHPGSMFLPVGVSVVEDPKDLALFEPYYHPDFNVERIVLVTNQMGDRRVAVYAVGQLRDGVTAADIQRQAAEINMGLSAKQSGGESIGPEGAPAEPADEQQSNPPDEGTPDEAAGDSQPPE
ncbi:MAG: hypothetical protein HND57_05435 [Planctomycetes bacterium]|nr:hypothetical protein [Planctomycetota bacterium]